jgi:DNA-binding MarR family transcriptional regulator
MKQNNSLQPSLIESKEKIFSLLRTTQKKIRKQVAKESQRHGFTYPQMFLIFSLNKNPGINLNDLSERLELSKSTVSGIINRLVRQRIVVREIPEEDRRTVRLSLNTDFLGRFNIQEFKNNLLSDLLKDASKEDLESIIFGFEKLLEFM